MGLSILCLPKCQNMKILICGEKKGFHLVLQQSLMKQFEYSDFEDYIIKYWCQIHFQ